MAPPQENGDFAMRVPHLARVNRECGGNGQTKENSTDTRQLRNYLLLVAQLLADDSQFSHRPIVDVLIRQLREADVTRVPGLEWKWHRDVERILERRGERDERTIAGPRNRPGYSIRRRIDRELARKIGDELRDQQFGAGHLAVRAEIDGERIARS